MRVVLVTSHVSRPRRRWAKGVLPRSTGAARRPVPSAAGHLRPPGGPRSPHQPGDEAPFPLECPAGPSTSSSRPTPQCVCGRCCPSWQEGGSTPPRPPASQGEGGRRLRVPSAAHSGSGGAEQRRGGPGPARALSYSWKRVPGRNGSYRPGSELQKNSSSLLGICGIARRNKTP